MKDFEKRLTAIEEKLKDQEEQIADIWENVNASFYTEHEARDAQAKNAEILHVQNERLKAVENAVMGLIGTEHDMRQDGEWHSLRKEAVYSEMSKLGYTKSSGLDEIATVFPLMRDSEGKKTCSCRPNGRGTKNTRAVVIRIRME